MNQKLHDAMDNINDAYLADAVAPKKRQRYRWLGAVAAVLAIVLVCAAVFPALKPRNPENPTYPYINYGLVAAPMYLSSLQSVPCTDAAMDALCRLAGAILDNADSENAVCSPLNTYMALSMLAEISGGNTQQQILDALGQSDPAALRSFATKLWQSNYKNTVYKSVLANSLWLSDGYSYRQETADVLARDYFASVYRGDLGSSNMQKAYRDWLNKETGGLLQDQTGSAHIPPETVLLLASTIYYQANWDDKFNEKANTQRIFQTQSGPVTATFMNDVSLTADDYYVGADCRAVRLALEDGSYMWLTLPNEGVDPLSVADFYRAPGAAQPVRLTLSVPKFDITAKTDLQAALKELGITDIFNDNADFSPITDGKTLPLQSVEHAARVAIDEDGVIGAAYTSIGIPGAAKPPEYPKAELIFDRPFTFSIVNSQGLPLFTGIVGNPVA